MSIKQVYGESGYPTFMREALALHNEYRTRHGVPHLQLNEEMCNHAQDWANTCAKSGRVDTMGNPDYGENVYTSTRDTTLNEVITKWYDDGRNGYQYTSENPKKKNYEFTQMIWKTTTDLGIGMSISSKGKVVIIALYWPRGNIRGHFVENVPQRLPDLVAEKPSVHLQNLITTASNTTSPSNM